MLASLAQDSDSDEGSLSIQYYCNVTIDIVQKEERGEKEERG